MNCHDAQSVMHGYLDGELDLFWPNSGTEPGDSQRVTRQGYHLVHWSNAGMNYWIVSDLNPTELNELAQRLRE